LVLFKPDILDIADDTDRRDDPVNRDVLHLAADLNVCGYVAAPVSFTTLADW
jgi:hypothetical protein